MNGNTVFSDKNLFYIMLAAIGGLGLAVIISEFQIGSQFAGNDFEHETRFSSGGADEPGQKTDQPEQEEKPLPESLPLAVSRDVPFTSQAPYGNWDDERYQNACEEASILMAWHWIIGKELDAQTANAEIADMNAFERQNYGFYIDSSAEDTARLFRDYYGHNGVRLEAEVSTERIKRELVRGNLVIVPADGRLLGNPNFQNGGPDRHMVVISGYDENRQVFITNDPGTRNGEDWEYSYVTIMNSIRDYISGDHEPVTEMQKRMIVVEPS